MLPRMNIQQRRRANKLLKHLCANYQDGNCLLLDDDEPCVCVQSISYSLCCNYFRVAVLPTEPTLEASSLSDMPAYFSENAKEYEKRTVLVKKLKMLPYEFIVRGYMFGSLWKEYNASGGYCGQKIHGQYELAQKLDNPIITPSAKNAKGHDENISIERLRDEIGTAMADELCRISLSLYEKCYQHALGKGIIIADTKFEFGYDEYGRLTLGDEIFTPDSSRFWAAEDYQTGVSPKSYDKQFVRDWLIQNKLNGITPAPELPDDIVKKTEMVYKDCYRKITEKKDY